MERSQACKWHLLPEEHKGRDKLIQQKKERERSYLTRWRAQMEGQVRIQKASKQGREDSQSGECRETSQNAERKQASKQYSQTGEHRGRDKSGHGKQQVNKGNPPTGGGREWGQVRRQKESE